MNIALLTLRIKTSTHMLCIVYLPLLIDSGESFVSFLFSFPPYFSYLFQGDKELHCIQRLRSFTNDLMGFFAQPTCAI